MKRTSLKKDLILAIDQGTSSSRVVIVDAKGRILVSASRPLHQFYPRPGWVEQSPEEIWKTVYACVQETLQRLGTKSSRIVAIGITNQRETTVLWEAKTGRAVGPAIVWQCRRSAKICETLKRTYGEEFFHQRTGLVVDPYFSATKILWYFDHDPDLRRRAQRGEIFFGTVDSWLLWKLTGGKVHGSDLTNASRTLLLNIQTGQWDEEILKALKIPRPMLPEVKNSITDFGRTVRHGILPNEIPITGIAGDQQAALFGQACFEPGMVKNTYGTGCFILWSLGKKRVLSKRGLITTWACFGKENMGYALEGSVFIAGAAIQWLRDNLSLLAKSGDSANMAAGLKSNEGVYLVPAFTGLGAPYWDAHARGALFGLTRGTGKAHIVRAALEAIAYQTKDVVEAMAQEVGVPLKELRVDGGASQNDLLMQFQADLLNCEVDRPDQIETTVLGAAYMAGLGVGLWRDNREIAQLRKKQRRFRPKMKEEERQRLYEGWKEAVTRTIMVRSKG